MSVNRLLAQTLDLAAHAAFALRPRSRSVVIDSPKATASCRLNATKTTTTIALVPMTSSDSYLDPVTGANDPSETVKALLASPHCREVKAVEGASAWFVTKKSLDAIKQQLRKSA